MGIDYRPELDLAKCAKGRDRSVVLHTKPNHLLPSKDWGIERWRKLSAVLQEAGFKIRQVGDREEPLLEGVAKRLE
jgi:hypothetical protein